MRLLAQTMTFVSMMIGCTILCAVMWQRFVTDTRYNCTDSAGLPDYFVSSRHWVHNPVAVEHVVSHRSMSEPDTIKAGWSIIGLMCLRWTFVGASFVLSLSVARSLWNSPQSHDLSNEHAA
jgi:hypothetical protein